MANWLWLVACLLVVSGVVVHGDAAVTNGDPGSVAQAPHQRPAQSLRACAISSCGSRGIVE